MSGLLVEGLGVCGFLVLTEARTRRLCQGWPESIWHGVSGSVGARRITNIMLEGSAG